MTQSKTCPPGTVEISCLATCRGEECRAAVLSALQHGLRHIDTASIYKNEADIGLALKESGIKRSDIFITSK